MNTRKLKKSRKRLSRKNNIHKRNRKKHKVRKGGGENVDELKGQNKILQEQNRLLNRRVDESLRETRKETKKKKPGLLKRSFSSVVSLLPGRKNLVSDSEEIENKERRESEMQKELKREENDAKILISPGDKVKGEIYGDIKSRLDDTIFRPPATNSQNQPIRKKGFLSKVKGWFCSKRKKD